MDLDFLLQKRLNKGIIWLIILNILDFITTWLVLYKGGIETNPVMQFAGNNIYRFGIYKALIIAAYILIVKNWGGITPQKVNIVWLMDIVFAGIVIFNIFNICVLYLR